MEPLIRDISMNYDFYPWHVWQNRQTKCVILTRRQSKNGLWPLSKSLVDHYMKALAEGRALQVTVLLMTPDDRIVGQYAANSSRQCQRCAAAQEQQSQS